MRWAIKAEAASRTAINSGAHQKQLGLLFFIQL